MTSFSFFSIGSHHDWSVRKRTRAEQKTSPGMRTAYVHYTFHPYDMRAEVYSCVVRVPMDMGCAVYLYCAREKTSFAWKSHTFAWGRKSTCNLTFPVSHILCNCARVFCSIGFLILYKVQHTMNQKSQHINWRTNTDGAIIENIV